MLDDLKKLPPRTVYAAVLAMLVLTLLAGYLYVFKKPVKEYQQLRSVRSQAVQDVEQAQLTRAHSNQLQQLQNLVTNLGGKLYGKGARLPISQMVSYVIAELDRISHDHNVQLVSVKPGPAEAVLVFDEIPFDVEVVGGFAETYDWLREVEQALRPMLIKQFRILPNGGEQDVSTRLRIVYYRPDEEAS